ncbi:MAG: CDP-archaeol synthase [Lentisphaerales bacterium]|nr:MAG: CDP-archaeol synthase [Lentisphaerales bacterium]
MAYYETWQDDPDFGKAVAAGSTLKKRLMVAAVMVPIVCVAILYLPSAGLLVLLAMISTVVTLEFYDLLAKIKIPSFRYVGATAGILVLLATYVGLYGENGTPGRAAEATLAIMALTVCALLVRQMPQNRNKKPLSTISCTLLGICYIPLLLSFFIRLAFTWDVIGWRVPLAGHTGGSLVLYVCVVAKLTDAGALFAGSMFGRHKLFPRISPGKTWEGLAGGLGLGVLSSSIFLGLGAWRLGNIYVGIPHAILLGLAIAVSATLGDLAESLMKRASSAKDSARLFPGLGGGLDIMDSILFALPVTYVYVRLLL